jgi:hypothetical protein
LKRYSHPWLWKLKPAGKGKATTWHKKNKWQDTKSHCGSCGKILIDLACHPEAQSSWGYLRLRRADRNEDYDYSYAINPDWLGKGVGPGRYIPAQILLKGQFVDEKNVIM